MLEEYQSYADTMADKFGVRKELFRALITQESNWDLAAQSRKGAVGLGQIMPATAAKPGYGVQPVQDDSWQENLRFSAEYLSAMQRTHGSEELALAAYNAGSGAVLKAKGIPQFEETKQYVQKILLNAGGPHAVPRSAPVIDKFEQAKARILGNELIGAKLPEAELGSLTAMADAAYQQALAREAARKANVATADDVAQHTVANETLTGAVLEAASIGPADGFVASEEQRMQELAIGLHKYESLNSYVQGYKNKADYLSRLNNARMQMQHFERVGNATGWDAVKLAATGLAYGTADPVGAVATLPFALASNGVKVVKAMNGLSRLQAVGVVAAEGAASNALIEAGLQYALRTELDPHMVVQQGAFGAVLGSVISLPLQARSAGRVAGGMAEFDRLTGELGEAIDAGAHPSTVAALQRSIDEVKARVMEQASRDGDEIAQQVWANAGPGATSKDIAAAIREIHERKAQAGGTLDPLVEASPTDILGRDARHMLEGTATIDVAGMRLSAEATAVRKFAYELWDDAVDPALAGMQKRMQEFYNMREAKLGDYAGLAQWLDSPGLVLQASPSRVARMLGAHIFESASGYGKREQSAALNYEIMHSRLAHSYIPSLKEALIDGLKEAGGMNLVRHFVGGGRPAERAFWRSVMVERTAHRNAIRAGEQFVSTASEPVQRAAAILDNFWRESADHLETAGLEEGKAIKTLGVTGHVPYRWDASRISEALRNDPATFNAFQSMIQEEFRNKVLDGLLRDLEANGRQMLDKKRADLEGRISAIQDEIAGMEDARRVLDTARGQDKAVKDELSKLNAIRKTLLAQEKALKQELKTLPVQEEAVSADLRMQAGEVLFRRVAGSRMDELRANPDVREVTAESILAAVRKVAGVSERWQKEFSILADALEADFAAGGGEFPVFVTAKGEALPGLRSHYAAAGHYVVLNNVKDLSALTPQDAATALHELAHARTSRWLYKVSDFLGTTATTAAEGWKPARLVDVEAAAKVGIPAEVATAWNKLESVRGLLLERHPELVGGTGGIGYAMKNSHELLAQVMNDASVRTKLDSIKLDGERSLLRTVWEAVANVLFVKKQRTALSDVIEALDATSGMHGRWMEPSGKQVEFAPTRTRADVEAQLKALQEQKAAIDAQRAQMHGSKRATAEAKQKIADTSGVKKLDALRNQQRLVNAELADIQRDPLGYWGKRVQSLRSAAEAKADALTSSYLKQVIQDPESRAKGITLHAARLAEDLLKENWEGARIDPDLAEQFGTMLREKLADKTRTEFDLGRTRQVDGREVALMDFMDLDGLAQVKSGAHSVSGGVALARMGIKDPTGIAAALEAARTDGASDAEIKALQFGFDFLSNNLNGSDHAAMHALRNMTYFTRMGKLGMSMVADVPQMVSTLGLGLALKTWGQSFLQHSFNGRNAFGGFGKPTPFAVQLAKVAPGALGRDHRLMTLVADDPASGAADIAGGGLLQRVTARGAQFTSWISGANHINMAMHRALLPVLAEEVLGAVRGKSAINDIRLADMGMGQDLVQRVKAMMDKHDVGRKAGDAVNWDKWEDQLAADAVIAAIHRGMFQTLQKSLLGESPQWMTTSQMGRVIGQFRRFGLTAAEKMTARQAIGFRDTQALLTATMGLAWAGLLYYARVHVNAANKENAEEYIEQQLSPAALTRGVMTMWNMSGLGADFAGVGETLFGGTQRVEASPAAVLGQVKDIAKAAQAVGQAVTGEQEPGKAAAATMRLLPGANSVPLMYLLDELQKD